MRFPLNLKAYATDDDANIFENKRITPYLTQVPYGNHCGAFGVARTHDVHTGTDLYAPDGEPVYAITDGVVVGVFPFTGVDANCPWWLDTMAVAIEDQAGIWLYGEVSPRAELQVGTVVSEGDRIGAVKRVLRIFKGRPVSMLHMERYTPGTTEFAPIWEVGEQQPESLIDPTALLSELGRQ